MKKISYKLQLFISLILLLSIAACRRPSTTIVTSNGSFYQKIEYNGRIIFNPDNTGITDISSGGFLRFERNGKKFEAENGPNDKVVYSFNGDSEVNELSAEQKQLVSDAVKAIMKERSRAK